MFVSVITLSLGHLGVEGETKPVLQEIEPEDEKHDSQPRENDLVGGDKDIVAAIGEHGTPFRRGGLSSQSQEAETGCGQNGCSDTKRSHDEEVRPDVGEDMAVQDSKGSHPDSPAGLDVRLFFYRQSGSSCQSGEHGDGIDPHGDHGIDQARTENADDGYRQKDSGKGHQNVDEPHQDRVGLSAHKSGKDPQGNPDGHGQENRDEALQQRQACPVDDPRKDVPAQFIRPQEMNGAGRKKGLGKVVLERVVGRDQRGQKGDENEEKDDDSPGNGETASFQLVPDASSFTLTGECFVACLKRPSP